MPSHPGQAAASSDWLPVERGGGSALYSSVRFPRLVVETTAVRLPSFA